jgi:HlyD family secretion protein
MAISKKRRKIVIFSVIGLVLIGLTLAAVFRKKQPVITVQTDKVTRRPLMIETVVANGRIQPVVQVKISPEVSGEIVELPVKEGQQVKKGDLLLKIKPDVYIAHLKQAQASYESSLAGKATAEANLRKAEADYKRSQGLLAANLIPQSDFDQAQASYDVEVAQLSNSSHQVEMAKASVSSAQEDLDKTTIVSPLDGTISKLNSQLGERVLGTVQNVGTDIMTIADLNNMEARVDIGEIDVVLIARGQKARMEVDAFKDRKFTGTVTDIANSSKGSSTTSSSQSQEATKFEVRIRFSDKEIFRPGMSVSTEVETRYRTNALAVPMASVTTRVPKPPEKKNANGKDGARSGGTNSVISGSSNSVASGATNSVVSADATNAVTADKKSKETPKPSEVVFVVEGDHVKMVLVKIGICDDTYWEITEGLTEGQEIVSGGYKAISRDLEDSKKIRKGTATDKEPKT